MLLSGLFHTLQLHHQFPAVATCFSQTIRFVAAIVYSNGKRGLQHIWQLKKTSKKVGFLKKKDEFKLHNLQKKLGIELISPCADVDIILNFFLIQFPRAGFYS